MKNILFFLLVVLIAGCYGRSPKPTGLEGKAMPVARLLRLDSINTLNTDSIAAGQPSVFFYFSPTCPYCRAMTQELADNAQSVKGIRFYLVSNSPISDLKQYSTHYGLDRYDNIAVTQDHEGYLINYFGIRGVPYVVVFDKNKKIKRVFDGKASISAVKDIALGE